MRSLALKDFTICDFSVFDDGVETSSAFTVDDDKSCRNATILLAVGKVAKMAMSTSSSMCNSLLMVVASSMAPIESNPFDDKSSFGPISSPKSSRRTLNTTVVTSAR